MSSESKKHGRLFIFIGTVLALTVLAFNAIQVLFIQSTTRADLEEDKKEQYLESAKSYSLLIKNNIETLLAYLEYYCSSEVVCDGGTTSDIYEWLQEHEEQRYEKFDYVGWADRSGNLYCDIGKITPISDRDYYQSVMQKGNEIYIDDPVTSRTTGDTIIHICRAIKDGNDIKGFFCGVLNIKHIVELLEDINLGKNGAARLYSSEGEMIASSNGEDDDMQAIQEIYPESYEKYQEAWGSDEEKIFDSKSADGEEHLTISIPIEHTPWKMILLLENEVIYSSVSDVSLKLIITSIIITLALLLVITFTIYKSLKPLGIVEKTILGIASGEADLTKRIDLNSNNEIGRVVDGFNLFSDKLQTIIGSMKDARVALGNAGDLLQSSTEDTSSAIAEIISNVDSLNNHVENQAESVHQTAGAVNEIAANIESLNRMIESQTSAVTQASAAVEEMIGNIASVDSSVQKMATSFRELEEKAKLGVQNQGDVNAKIEEIQAESEALMEANTVILNIADQTNLLAMNAAIEAAHAGDAGKGFSVVADEIRKLSEDSGTQSQTIGQQLEKIIGSIDGIVKASKTATESFNEVVSGITSTNHLVLEISNAMTEQNEGSKQIAIALNSMNDTSNEVKTSSYEMAEGNKAILEEVKHLQDAAFAIKDGMNEMTNGARKINETGNALSGLSGQLKESIDNIGAQVDQFKV